jgi:hypothetical protein
MAGIRSRRIGDGSLVMTPTRERERMISVKFVLCAFALGLTTASVAAPAQGLPTELLVHFITSDRNIECEMVDPNTTVGNVTCALHSKGYTTRGDVGNHDLTASRSLRWYVDFSRPALVAASRRELGSKPTRILQYGGTLSVGYFRCTSRVSGLTCTSRHSGHGFFLSRTRQRTF